MQLPCPPKSISDLLFTERRPLPQLPKLIARFNSSWLKVTQPHSQASAATSISDGMARIIGGTEPPSTSMAQSALT